MRNVIFSYQKDVILRKYFWFLIVGLLLSCEASTVKENEEAVQLIKVRDSLEQVQKELKVRLDSMWKATNTELAAILPSDMPQQERNNMLALSNAPLIRMFEVYDSLPSNIHQLVDKAEAADKAIAVRFQEITEQKDANETKIEQLLLTLSKESKEEFDYWNAKFNVSSKKQK
ncbi:MAG: hypothetical protein HC892_12065 [Saprospiraceae bacterium]|nr:hypothetical protein [Saprospiraceae bacterium]